MEIDLLKKTDVIFRGREAILTGYFDAACLLFDKREKKPEWEDLKLIDDYYPKKYFLFFTDIPCDERLQIKLLHGNELLDCYCESFLFTQDLPKDLSEKDYIDIIGEDPFDYRMTGEGYRYNRMDVYAHTICKRCGRKLKVHFHDGYRLTYPRWELE